MEIPTTQPETAEAVREQREKAVLQAIDEHGDSVMRYLIGRTRHQHDAEDIFQQLLLYALRRGNPVKIQRIGWLKLKAKHLHLDLVRSRKRKNETEIPEWSEVSSAPTEGSASYDSEIELWQNFCSEYPVPDLEDKKKKSLWLHVRYNFSYIEVGEHLGVSKTTANAWALEARKKIAAFVNEKNQTA